MNLIIAVFQQNWVEAAPLFAFLNAFNIEIENQAKCGDTKDEIKNTHLYVNMGSNTAKWIGVEEGKKIMESEFCKVIHYERLVHDIKRQVEVQ